MKITNTTGQEHTVSINGEDHFLFPGASIEADLTKEEARAFSALFTVEGEPVKRPAAKQEDSK